jgi:hypothetical protein
VPTRSRASSKTRGDAEQDAEQSEDAKHAVVGPGKREGGFVDQLAAELQVAVVGRQQVLDADPVVVHEGAGVLDQPRVVVKLVP